MDEAKDIVQLNIAYYRELLVRETDPKKRATVSRLLAEQEAKLGEMEPEERS
jgi:hypothetical protein